VLSIRPLLDASTELDVARMFDVSMNVNVSWQNRPVPTTLPLLPTDAVICCSPVTGGVLTAEDAERIAHTFKALGDPTRVRLLSLIAASGDGEACICDLTEPVGLSQPTVSHHMKLLVGAGLATREQRGRWAYYRVVPDALEQASHALRP
jgi:ArsR family transcriptional regulator